MDELVGMLIDGIFAFLKLFLFYVAAPIFIGLIIFGGMLKFKGSKLNLALGGMVLLGFVLFYFIGFPELANMFAD